MTLREVQNRKIVFVSGLCSDLSYWDLVGVIAACSLSSQYAVAESNVGLNELYVVER